MISIALGYVLFVAAAQIGDRELKARLYELDTNGDGNFTDSEITPEVEERIRDVSSDTEKVLAPFTGVPLSAVWTSINLGVIFLIRAIVLGHKSRKCLSERST
ncbi:MAG: hypothetical protein ABI615_07685 [Chthoniobacterales bacterium]